MMVETLELFNGQLSYTEISNLHVSELNALRDARHRYLDKKQRSMDRMSADLAKQRTKKS